MALGATEQTCAHNTGWSAQFPNQKPTHFVFPSERVEFSGNDEVPEVFDTDPTKPITSWKTAWKTAKTSAGVECRFHDLRHTTCTRLLERAAPFAAVASIMGWSPGAAMRMAKRYAHIGKSIQREAIALLDPAPAPEQVSSQTPPRQSATNAATLVTGPISVQ